ncbi:MAG: MFS transporter [Acidimicrobiia bacterium]
MTRRSSSARSSLLLLSVALILGMSTWFSASAVIPQLEPVWDLDATSKAWLTIAVQLGFVVGALASAALNLSDILAPRLIIAAGGIGAGLANLALLAMGTAGGGITLRFLTGFFLAGVYPPAFKQISTWFQQGRGMAMGTLVGSLILGSALPHLVNALGGVHWESVIVTTTAFSLVGGLAALGVGDGPYPFPTASFDPRQISQVFRNRGVRLASIGYFGHMWELYAMYAWFTVFTSDHLAVVDEPALPTAAFITFAVIAAGFPGSYLGGILSDRWGRSKTTSLLLGLSGACSVGIGFLFGGPTWLLVSVGLVWGLTVVADSAQFSAIVTEVGDQSYVGTALTMQLAIGFSITVITIWVIPFLETAIGWRWAFSILALGPLVGIVAMQRLRRLPESALIAGGRG